MNPCSDIDFSRLIPIFPLPNAVLLPRAILPLHIFEPRYREMLADTLNDQALVAMAFLKPGYEERYYTHCAAIHEVVCVGRVVRHEMLEDGRYNLLLQGIVRAAVRSEDHELSYRRGLMVPLPAGAMMDANAAEGVRSDLCRLLKTEPLRDVARTANWQGLIRSNDIPLSDIIDCLAAAVCGRAQRAAEFLLERDTVRRAEWLLDELREYACRISTLNKAALAADAWPQQASLN